VKVVFALNAFKESLTAQKACEAVARGFRRGLPEIEAVLFPVADGGDGTLEALVAATAGTVIRKTVRGPLGEPVRARYGILGDGATAIVEMAKASGFALVPPRRRNPLKTTTFGTGQLIADAIGRGVRRVIVGLGGSATVDLGAGMAQALGAKLLDAQGKPIRPGGQGLADLEAIDLGALRERLSGIDVIGATDVTNPLLGARGGIRVFSPQKGATPDMVEHLHESARHAAGVIRRQLHVDVNRIPGAGAAGGFGAGIVAWLGGRLQSGIDVMLEAAHFDRAIEGAALVVTGEGRLDGQTRYGKAPAGVAARAQAAGIPCIAIAGGIGPGAQSLHELGIAAYFSICHGPVSLEEALQNAAPLAEQAAEQVARTIGRLMRKGTEGT
jgi:glycerate kinase